MYVCMLSLPLYSLYTHTLSISIYTYVYTQDTWDIAQLCPMHIHITYNDSFAVMYTGSKIVITRMRTIKTRTTIVTVADTERHNKRRIYTYVQGNAMQSNAMYCDVIEWKVS